LEFSDCVGWQTNRPFGINRESFENPQNLDKKVEMVGAEPVSGYEQKVTCCGSALTFSGPGKSRKQIRDIIESAYDHGAEKKVTNWPCRSCIARS